MKKEISMKKSDRLSVLAYANQFTLWHYKHEGDNIEEQGYFNDMADILRPDDLILSKRMVEATTDKKGLNLPNMATAFYIVSGRDENAIEIERFCF
jgi:alpha-L-arabinofuranosidase